MFSRILGVLIYVGLESLFVNDIRVSMMNILYVYLVGYGYLMIRMF